MFRIPLIDEVEEVLGVEDEARASAADTACITVCCVCSVANVLPCIYECSYSVCCQALHVHHGLCLMASDLPEMGRFPEELEIIYLFILLRWKVKCGEKSVFLRNKEKKG